MFHLFERFGLELEYMIVNRDTLDILPASDVLIKLANNGCVQNEIERGDIHWSNELVLHVIELKTGAPAVSIDGLAGRFSDNIREINLLLATINGVLLPGPMHPLMDPVGDMHLWPYENSPIYTAFDRIFSCKGHGWSNLQSMHINLPFQGDAEFDRLHTAIRLLLPVIPGLSAGSPLADGVDTGFSDYRMEVYRTNSQKIPVITGNVIPDVVCSKHEYEENILKKIYKELKPFDPEGVLQEEWVNARGAIARFERDTIEIRIIDVQECPLADMAIAAAVTGVLQLLTEEKLSAVDAQKKPETGMLGELFREVIRHGERAVVNDRRYCDALGISGVNCTVNDVWSQLLAKLDSMRSGYLDPFRHELHHIVRHGTLATRIRKKLGAQFSRDEIRRVYRDLAECLSDNRMF
jgi:gamma-glutamyl:cysteine ligase YbdK (ATP-grasp superfamily)